MVMVPSPALKQLMSVYATVKVGNALTVKSVALLAVPLGVVTLIAPVVAPAGRVAVIWVALFTVKVADCPSKKVTAVAPVKLVPLITTDAPEPVQALVGAKLVMVGVADKV